MSQVSPMAISDIIVTVVRFFNIIRNFVDNLLDVYMFYSTDICMLKSGEANSAGLQTL